MCIRGVNYHRFTKTDAIVDTIEEIIIMGHWLIKVKK